MEKSELVSYARQKYNVDEKHKWAKFPTFSVLAHPENGTWVALFTSRKEADGTVVDVCDLKCGLDSIVGLKKPYLGSPFRMRGANWVGVIFNEHTESDVVCSLLDKAMQNADPGGYKVVLDNRAAGTHSFGDTPIPRLRDRPAGDTGQRSQRDAVPQKILLLRQMIRSDLQHYGMADMTGRARAFFAQAEFMADYEDDVPWQGPFFKYYPTYADLTMKQLRAYFAWRTKIRANEYAWVPPSAAYIYLYELLNGVGAKSLEETLKKLEEFEACYLTNEDNVASLRSNLRRWKFDLCVLHDLPLDMALRYMDPKKLARDNAIGVLKDAQNRSDREVMDALMLFSEKARSASPVIAADEERAQHLFAQAWRFAAAGRPNDLDLFTACFGEYQEKRWFPLGNALYYDRTPRGDRSYRVDETRTLTRRGNEWRVGAYERVNLNLDMLRAFMHAVDLKLRRFLKTGRYLRSKSGEEWALPYIDEAVRQYEKELEIASRPKIRIDLGDLDKIRRDAAKTRDSLLTEEERGADDVPPAAAQAKSPENPKLDDVQVGTAEQNEDGPLTPAQSDILRALLGGRPVSDILAKDHLMPTIAADEINEALFDLIGDNVLTSDNDELALVEDYRDEAAQIVGG